MQKNQILLLISVQTQVFTLLLLKQLIIIAKSMHSSLLKGYFKIEN